MKDVDYYNPTPAEISRRRWGLRPFDEDNRRVLLAVFSLFGIPKKYLDVGSGSGAMVKLARRCGVDAVGIDLIAKAPDIVHDMRVPLNLGRQFDLITSIETAEHLPEDSSMTLVRSITEHLSDNGVLVFTAALPGQPGHNHVALYRPDHWRHMFREAGLEYWHEKTVTLALLWTYTARGLVHLPGNLQCFRKR